MLNLKFALRTLFKTPFVTIVAIVSLALGIGANAAIFSLFNQLLLQPVAVPQPTGLVNLSAPGPKPGSSNCSQIGDCEEVFSYPMFRDLERVQTPFTGIAAHVTFGANFSARGQTENGDGLLVSGSYFPVLGLEPAIGRLLGPEDDKAPGEPHVVVLSRDHEDSTTLDLRRQFQLRSDVPPLASLFVLGLFVALVLPAHAAIQQASLRIEVRSSSGAVAGASVVVNGARSRTDTRGAVVVAVAPGAVDVVVAKEGFEPASLSLTVAAGEERTVTVDLAAQTALEEHVTVAATRTERGIDDEPIRVEVLDRDEIEEKLMMTPGDIVMMLNEMGGLRAQATSPSLGAASVRIQGMRGRYTRFLSDGLPLFGEQAGSFGIMQIPPIDLGQVEVIKGVASSLYGAGAIGGVVNLVSRRPSAQTERQLLLNRSTRGATDAAIWYSAPLSDRWGVTLLGSANGQARADVDGDAWADLPRYTRALGRPRIFWDDHAGRSFYATAGVTWEDRVGGTLPGATLPAAGGPYREGLDTRRFDVGSSYQALVGGASVVSARASATHQRQDHQFGDQRERDTHSTTFAEVALRRAIGRHTVVGGAAFERDSFRPIDVPRFAYTFTVPGAFVQDDVTVARWAAVSAGVRVDRHSEHGTFVSPRVSSLFRFGAWTSRLSYGAGFSAPTPLIEETEAAGLSRLAIPTPLAAERGRSASLDISRSSAHLATTLTLFASRVRNPVEAERDDRFALVNRAAATRNAGLEALAIYRLDALSIVANYAWVRAREGEGADRVDVPLTPRHSVGIDGMWTWADGRDARLGIEWYYTGEQRLEANPYRDRSRPYHVFGVLFERRVGRARLFVNGENLTDVRQTRWDPIVRPARGADGRWTVDGWAPLDGRAINGGVRFSF